MDDTKLWKDFVSGNRKAFSAIFLDHYDTLFSYGVKLCGDKDMVQDCIQDLFLKLWKNHAALKSLNHIKPYLLRSLRNQIIDTLKLRSKLKFYNLNAIIDFKVEFTGADFSYDLQATEDRRKKVAESLNKLSPRQREVIYLRYFENLEFSIISQVMDMNVQSVRNILQRAKSSLKEKMIMR
ncbi:MAG TPA: RNA polymerase sigma factor [Bacteroidales bacterium]|nr:RNA polymerase sigma factor [Bacteroidales bacterium]